MALKYTKRNELKPFLFENVILSINFPYRNGCMLEMANPSINKNISNAKCNPSFELPEHKKL